MPPPRRIGVLTYDQHYQARRAASTLHERMRALEEILGRGAPRVVGVSYTRGKRIPGVVDLPVVVTGSRGIYDYDWGRVLIEEALKDVLAEGVRASRIVVGRTTGVDRIAQHFARLRGLPCERVAGDWDWLADGEDARCARDHRLLDEAGAVIAIYQGGARGVHRLLRFARDRRVPICLAVQVES